MNAQTGLELETVQNELPADYSADAWHARQEKIQRSLDRIGTVNLLAIEEFEEQSERAKYLEAQFEDLTGALEPRVQMLMPATMSHFHTNHSLFAVPYSFWRRPQMTMLR